MAQEQEDRRSRELLEEAIKAVLAAIINDTPSSTGNHIRDLAEVYAWLRVPGQPHGGSMLVPKG